MQNTQKNQSRIFSTMRTYTTPKLGGVIAQKKVSEVDFGNNKKKHSKLSAINYK